jgi:hypothetical protein
MRHPTNSAEPSGKVLRATLRWLGLVLLLAGAVGAHAEDGVHAGFLFDESDLTLSLGHRTEAAGPLFYDEQTEEQHTWAVPPLISLTRNPGQELKEFDMLYPVLSYDRYGEQYRWQFFQILSWAGGPTQTATNRHRFTLFPVYFQQRSSQPEDNYTAVFPFYGHLKHRLFKDEMSFVMFPLYGETRKRDVVTDNYVYPFFHLRHGDGLTGWQLWPFVGEEHKDITTRTNRFGDEESVPGHDSRFVLWPFYFEDRMGLGSDNPQWQLASLPLFSLVRSPKRDSTTVLWPFFSHVTDRDKQYREWDLPWPLMVFARGEGKTTTRVFPFYSHAQSPTLESDFVLWPVYKYNRAQMPPLDRVRKRILFFLYSDITDKNTQTGKDDRRVDLWPFYLYQRDFNGSTRLQVPALLETFVHGSHKVPRNWSPVWTLWRSEHNAKTGASSQSLLWNLYRHESGPDHKLLACLFGLYQSEAGPTGKRLRVFYIPLSKSHDAAAVKTSS